MKPLSIVVVGKRWRRNNAGICYHSVQVCVNGVEIAYSPFNFGGGETFIETAKEFLVDSGFIDIDNYAPDNLTMYFKKKGIPFKKRVVDVAEKNELKI